MSDGMYTNLARALALAEAEIIRLLAENAAQRAALDEAVGALLAERAVNDAARAYILYSAATHGGSDDRDQIELLAKWYEACKRRQEGER